MSLKESQKNSPWRFSLSHVGDKANLLKTVLLLNVSKIKYLAYIQNTVCGWKLQHIIQNTPPNFLLAGTGKMFRADAKMDEAKCKAILVKPVRSCKRLETRMEVPLQAWQFPKLQMNCLDQSTFMRPGWPKDASLCWSFLRLRFANMSHLLCHLAKWWQGKYSLLCNGLFTYK